MHLPPAENALAYTASLCVQCQQQADPVAPALQHCRLPTSALLLQVGSAAGRNGSSHSASPQGPPAQQPPARRHRQGAHREAASGEAGSPVPGGPAEVGSLELGTAELLSADDCSFQLLPEGYCQGTLLGLF